MCLCLKTYLFSRGVQNFSSDAFICVQRAVSKSVVADVHFFIKIATVNIDYDDFFAPNYSVPVPGHESPATPQLSPRSLTLLFLFIRLT